MAKASIENILEWRKRRGDNSLSFTIINDLRDIERVWRDHPEIPNEFIDFIPIRIVTLIEVFIREKIRELVDHGSPYIDRADNLAKGSKIDFSMLVGLQGQKITVGDMISHAVSISTPSHIIGCLSALIPDFVDRLRLSHELWTEDASDWPLRPIISDYDSTMKQLSRLFTVNRTGFAGGSNF